MAVPINFLAVLVCAIASMALGFLWYGPLFGKHWMEWSGKTKKDMEAAKSGMIKSYVIMFIGSLVMAFVLAHALVFASTYLKMSGIEAGLMAGFWNWLGFVAPVTIGMVLWDGKPWKLWILTNGFQLIQLMIFGVILSLWPA
jgi:hypothetical protein